MVGRQCAGGFICSFFANSCLHIPDNYEFTSTNHKYYFFHNKFNYNHNYNFAVLCAESSSIGTNGIWSSLVDE